MSLELTVPLGACAYGYVHVRGGRGGGTQGGGKDCCFFLTHGSVHNNSMLIKIQPDATVCRYLFTA